MWFNVPVKYKICICVAVTLLPRNSFFHGNCGQASRAPIFFSLYLSSIHNNLFRSSKNIRYFFLLKQATCFPLYQQVKELAQKTLPKLILLSLQIRGITVRYSTLKCIFRSFKHLKPTRQYSWNIKISYMGTGNLILICMALSISRDCAYSLLIKFQLAYKNSSLYAHFVVVKKDDGVKLTLTTCNLSY